MKQYITITLFVIFGLQLNAQEFKFTNHSGINHDGLYLSLSLGVNHADLLNTEKTNGDDGTDKNKYYYRGFRSQLDFKAGAALSDRDIVHGTLLYYRMSGPTLDDDLELTDMSNSVVVNEGMLGGGFTYFLNANNTFLSGSMGVGGFSSSKALTGYDGNSNLGLAFQLQAGKDWYLTDRLNMGFAFSYGVCNAKNKPTSGVVQQLNSNNWSIMLHLAFN